LCIIDHSDSYAQIYIQGFALGKAQEGLSGVPGPPGVRSIAGNAVRASYAPYEGAIQLGAISAEEP